MDAGDVDTGLYTEDCLFADPTISFRGRDKYIRNLQLLKGFFNEPYIDLKGLARENPEEAKLKAGLMQRPEKTLWTYTILRLRICILVKLGGKELVQFHLRSLLTVLLFTSKLSDVMLQSRLVRKGMPDENIIILQAMWRLTMQLKLPWKPLIDIDGSTSYTLDEVTFQVISGLLWIGPMRESILQSVTSIRF